MRFKVSFKLTFRVSTTVYLLVQCGEITIAILDEL
jgi:hypothetical protein